MALARLTLSPVTALSRRERLMLGAGLTALSLVARVAERHDRRHGRRRFIPTQYAPAPTGR
jgi:hypothetical protein